MLRTPVESYPGSIGLMDQSDLREEKESCKSDELHVHN